MNPNDPSHHRMPPAQERAILALLALLTLLDAAALWAVLR
jgi:hypothetical protein